MEITSLAQYGLTGVSIALIIALIVIIKAVLTYNGNHINHNTKALTKLCEKIDADSKERQKIIDILINLFNKTHIK